MSESVGWWCLFRSYISLVIFCRVGLSLSEREFLNFPTTIVDMSFLFLFLWVFAHVFKAIFFLVHTFLRLLCLLGELKLLSLNNFLLSLVIFFILKFNLSDINIYTIAFLKSLFAWYISFRSYIFNLPILLYLNHITCF